MPQSYKQRLKVALFIETQCIMKNNNNLCDKTAQFTKVTNNCQSNWVSGGISVNWGF